MKHLYFLSIVLFSLSATAQLKDCATCATQVIKEQQIRKLSIKGIIVQKLMILRRQIDILYGLKVIK